MNPLRSVGARLSLALVVVVALALVLVYVIVVPSLRSHLIDAKLNRMEKELPTVVAEIPVTEARANWADNLERWSGRADARVVVYTIQTTGNGSGPSTLNVYRDSSGVSSLDVVAAAPGSIMIALITAASAARAART